MDKQVALQGPISKCPDVSVFVLLVPNGAGKTNTVHVLSTTEGSCGECRLPV